MCFHILGIDIMIDDQLDPYVIEVNHTPSFVTDTPLDYHIKFDLIKDTLKLMNIDSKSKISMVEKANQIYK
jgi:tubulin polyglutamylase TTLL6/13